MDISCTIPPESLAHNNGNSLSILQNEIDHKALFMYSALTERAFSVSLL